jgi:hypothetical protein
MDIMSHTDMLVGFLFGKLRFEHFQKIFYVIEVLKHIVSSLKTIKGGAVWVSHKLKFIFNTIIVRVRK